jgi:hypothetical protein
MQHLNLETMYYDGRVEKSQSWGRYWEHCYGCLLLVKKFLGYALSFVFVVLNNQ